MVKFEVGIKVTDGNKPRPEYTINSDLNGEITLKDLLEWTKQTLIVLADQALQEEQAAGFDKSPVTIVDGKKNNDIRTVHPLGSIEYVSRQSMTDILITAYEALLERSKVVSGLYKSSHYVFHNGIQVANDLSSLKSWVASSPQFKNKDVVRFVNIQPYGRRLELLGVTAQRSRPKREDKGRRKGIKTGVVFKVPNGTYQLTARSLKSRFKQNVGIRFTFIPGSSLGISGSFKKGRAGKNSAGRPYLYPSIVFTVQEGGIL